MQSCSAVDFAAAFACAVSVSSLAFPNCLTPEVFLPLVFYQFALVVVAAHISMCCF
jgi:hypothetical protein